MTAVYVVCTIAGFALLIVGVAFDDVLDVIPIESEFISLPIVASAIGGFGLAGWITGSTGAAAGIAVVVALAISVAFVLATAWFTRQLASASTDATPTASDLVGTIGRVVTPIEGGSGEVILRLGGQQRKLTAHSDDDLELGATTITTAALSPSAVQVERHQPSTPPLNGANQ